jgi:hypothetical protein
MVSGQLQAFAPACVRVPLRNACAGTLNVSCARMPEGLIQTCVSEERMAQNDRARLLSGAATHARDVIEPSTGVITRIARLPLRSPITL